MITGHATLKYHLHKMKIEDDAICPNCWEGDETVEHFICDCPAFMWARQQTFGQRFLDSQDLRTLKYDVLLEYIKTTHRFEH